MSHVKAKAIREMSAEEIRTRLQELREEVFNLRFRNAMKQLDDALRIRIVKRDLARIRTVLREHQLGIRKMASES